MKSNVKATICGCVIVCAGPAAADVVNGSFEHGAFAGGSSLGQQVLPADTSLSGWTVNNDPITWYRSNFAIRQGDGSVRNLTPHSGDFALNLSDGSVRTVGDGSVRLLGDGSVRFVAGDGSVRLVSVSQTISTQPSQKYRVTYWLGNYGSNGGPSAITASITDGASNTIIVSETATAPATDEESWERFSFDFIGDGTSNTITFAEAIDRSYIGGVGPTYTGLDDISVAAVPEASTWVLVLIGFVGLGVVGFRRSPRLSPA